MITVQAVAEFYDSFGWLACGMPEYSQLSEAVIRWTLGPFIGLFDCLHAAYVWPGSVMVRALESRLKGPPVGVPIVPLGHVVHTHVPLLSSSVKAKFHYTGPTGPAWTCRRPAQTQWSFSETRAAKKSVRVRSGPVGPV